MQGSHTLGKPKKPPKGPQRHSAGNIDYDNLESRDSVENSQSSGAFRSRSKTVSDAGKNNFNLKYIVYLGIFSIFSKCLLLLICVPIKQN